MERPLIFWEGNLHLLFLLWLTFTHLLLIL
jgi:hypothetical protein